MPDRDLQRGEMLERWERAAAGWERRAGTIRDIGMPVAVWMIEHLDLQPGQRVLELAAGPGDTGFLAAELIRPAGVVLSSDGTEAMVDVARRRAGELGIENVKFMRLELEWIDLPAAAVDAVLCRWGLMLTVDPAAALREARRVLRPGGRIAVAVWDLPERNAWATIPAQALVELGKASPPDPAAPGMFALAGDGRLQGLLESAGFLDVLIETVQIKRRFTGVDGFLAETLDLSQPFGEVFEGLPAQARTEVRRKIEALVAPFTAADGTVQIAGRSLVAAASA